MSISGVYELCIGTSDAAPLVRYWEQFGYRIGQEGELSAGEALKLYGVNSSLRSIRLLHQDSDHGLIRLLVWEKPTGAGLGLSKMKVRGNRWGAMMTADIYNALNHAEEAAAAKQLIYYVEPQRAEIYALEKRPTPFIETLPCVREMALIQPLTRQVIFQRFGYTLPLYGKLNEASHFRASQVTHAGLVVSGDPAQLDFYDQVLGLLRVRDGSESTDANSSSRNMFALGPGERYITTDFDDPRSSKTDPQRMRSGRLKIVRFPADVKLEDKMSESRPGQLGYSLYTFRVRDIEAYQVRVKASAARDVTALTRNEFGENSFSFIAPDGYFWTLLE